MKPAGIERNRAIIQTSVFGIVGNLVISVFKLYAGVVANSVSIIADGVNNITDSLSAVITIIGTKLSEREPDREHPFGYGRIEYLSSLTIGIIILYAGLHALQESVLRILRPQPVSYTWLTMLVVLAGLIIKLAIGLYTKKAGKRLDSEALIASGADAVNDSTGSAAILLAALVYLATGFSIEAWVGAAIAILIAANGIHTLRITAHGILGEPAELEKVNAVRDAILTFPEVEGVYDIVIHSYGREKLLGSAHIEVHDTYTVAWVDNLQRAIIRKVKKDTGVEMLGLSIYAINTRSEAAIKAREEVRAAVRETEGALEMHGFYIDNVDKTMNFEVMLQYGTRSRESLHDELLQKLQKKFPEYHIHIRVEPDFREPKAEVSTGQ